MKNMLLNSFVGILMLVSLTVCDSVSGQQPDKKDTIEVRSSGELRGPWPNPSSARNSSRKSTSSSSSKMSRIRL